MKKIITILISLAAILTFAVSAQAYSVGELNNDGIVNAGDALLILKHSAKVASLSNDISKFADINWDGSINAADALCVLKFSAKIEDMPDNNPYFYEMQEYNGMMINKLPYTYNGLSIKNVELDQYGYMKVYVENNTGRAIGDYSYFNYRCINVDGEVVKEGSFSLKELNDGETGISGFYLTDNTYKVVFSDAKIYDGITSVVGETTNVSGITTNALPHNISGLQINSLSIDKYGYATINVTNNVGSAIKSNTCIYYKCYDAGGNVEKSSAVYLKEINNGQNCDAGFYLGDNTVKVIFYAADVDVDLSTGNIPMDNYNGISANKIPYTFAEKLTINSISISGDTVKIKVKNGTGSTTSASTYISYKCINSAGTVVASNSLFLKRMNNGESCEATFSKPSDTAQIIFHESKVYTIDAIPAYKTSAIDGVEVNVLPATFEGLDIESFDYASGTAQIVVSNGSGKVVSDGSYINYRCFDSDGVVIKDLSVNVKAMSKNEKCRTSFSVPDGTKKILFDSAKLYYEVDVPSITTANYNGISMNACPYTSNGIKLSALSVDEYGRVTATFINETGAAIKSSSSVLFKCYDSAGVVVKSGVLGLNNMNNGDSYDAGFYKTDDTVKILFYNFEAKQ